MYLAVGIPGCGKSTYAEKLVSNGRVQVVISTDRIREELTGDATEQGANQDVFEIARNRARAALNLDWSVFIDATNLRPEFRADFARIADEAGAARVALYFQDSENLELCLERNKNRERCVPEDVIERFYKLFQENCRPDQLIQEGWSLLAV